MLVSPPNDFLRGDLNVDVGVDGLYEDGVIACQLSIDVDFCVDFKPLEHGEGIF